MQDCIVGLEETIISQISIKERIECLKPEIIDMIQEEYGDIDTYIQSFENKEAVDRLIERLIGLGWREQKVIMLRFGLLDGKAKTLDEVVGIMGITRERVRQIESKCLRRGGCRLRRSKRLRDYLD